MTTGLLDRERLVRPEGGSLNQTQLTDTEFIKSYAGPLPRGYEKLLLEYRYLRDLPDGVAAHFPHVNAFHHDAISQWTELRLERIKYPAFGKAILRGLITPARVKDQLTAIVAFLTDDLYPLRTGEISGRDLYRRFHAERMATALGLLTQRPYIRELVTAPRLVVNGVDCPSPADTLAWLQLNSADLMSKSHRLVAGHGDTHLDNMMIATDGTPNFYLIDPRGDTLLPPHYDLAKLLKALRTGYDLVHYGGYHVGVQSTPDGPSVSLKVRSDFGRHYRAGMEVLVQALPKFSQAEGVTERAFVKALRVAEYAHVISFASYHANRPDGCDEKRVAAYLAIAALLGRDLREEIPDLGRPLPIWSSEEP